MRRLQWDGQFEGKATGTAGSQNLSRALQGMRGQGAGGHSLTRQHCGLFNSKLMSLVGHRDISLSCEVRSPSGRSGHRLFAGSPRFRD